MWKILLAGAFTITTAGAASAAPLEIERYSYTYVTPSGADFSGSSFVYNNTINFDTDPGSLTQTINFQPVATSITVYGQGATTVSAGSVPDHTPSMDETFDSPGGGGQGFGLDYNGVASSVAGQSFLTYGTMGGRYALMFNGGGTNLVDTGGRFISFAIITGDYSDASTHTAATYGAGYALVDDFSYNAMANATTVAVETTNYQGINPTLSFSLLGSQVSVPEPASIALLGLGLAGIGAHRRRKAA